MGLTPLLCTWLTHKTGLLTFPAFYIMALGLLALPVVLRLKSEPPKPAHATADGSIALYSARPTPEKIVRPRGLILKPVTRLLMT